MTVQSSRAKFVALSLFLTVSLSACAPVGLVIGAGAVAGLSAYQERGIDGVSRDLGTSSRILGLYASNDHVMLKDIGVEVYESRALLTGIAPTEQMRADAVRLAWQADGVKDVINEILVSPDTSFLDTARDAWISTRLETKLTFDEKILAINYVIETVAGTVYLIGIAQNEQELERVKNHARSLSYVKHIVSHVRLKAATTTPTPGS